MKANPRPHGTKPLSCLPFDSYRAILTRRNGETRGVVEIAEDVRHWVKYPNGKRWVDDYEYKVLNKAEFDTFEAIGIPVLKVNYRPILKWFARARHKKWPIYAVLISYAVVVGSFFVEVNGYFTNGGQHPYLILAAFVTTGVLVGFMTACAWASTEL